MSLPQLLLANAVGALCLALVAHGLARLRLPARWMHVLWILVLAKLVAPPLVGLPWVRGFERLDGGETAAGAAGGWPAVGLALWGLGTLAFLALVALRTRRVASLAGEAEEARPELQAEARELADALGLPRVPRIALVAAEVSPCVVGLGARTVLLLPMSLVAELDPARRRMVLAHELAHVARRDHWVRVLELVACALFWWNPVAWLARRELRRWEELACDARVVASWPAEARAYAAALVETVAFLARPARSATALTGGDVAARVRRILAPERGRVSAPALGAALAPFALLMPLAPARVSPGLASARAGERWVVHASDPEGAFVLEFAGPEVTGVVLDGRRLARHTWSQEEGLLSVRPERSSAFEVRLLADRQITWEARLSRER